MLQKCCKLQSREPAASGTWHRGSGCSPVLMLNLGAENPHGASAYVPEDPHTDGMVRPPKPARKEHEAPGGALTGGSRSFTSNSRDFHVQRTGQACTVNHMLPNPDTAVNTHVEGAEIPLQLHFQGRRSPFLPLISMPDLPQNNFFLGQRPCLFLHSKPQPRDPEGT